MQLFGKSADPKEQMRKWKKEMRGEQRKVDRQINRAHPPDLSPPRMCANMRMSHSLRAQISSERR